MKPELLFRQSLRSPVSGCRSRLAHTRAYFTSPDKVEPRNYTNELVQILKGQQQTAEPRFQLEQQYQPQYRSLALDMDRLTRYGYDDADGVHHPGTLEMGRDSTQYQREGDLQDLATLGPAFQAAFLNANPALARTLGNLEGRTQDSPLLLRMNSQAMEGLDANGELSPEEVRNITQQTRSGFAARGTFGGNQALGAELLARDAARRQRQQQAQQYAGQVQGLNFNQADLVGRAAQIFGTQLSDPVQTVLGRTSGAGGSTGSGGYPQLTGTGATIFNPTDPFAGDIFSSNQQNQVNQNAAEANASNANTSAIISGVLALLSDKRVKKNIKPTGRKTSDGIPIKRFTYKTDKAKRTFEGVMAQDVKKVRPDAVLEDPMSGLLAVDYGKIEAPFAEVRRMLKKAA